MFLSFELLQAFVAVKDAEGDEKFGVKWLDHVHLQRLFTNVRFSANEQCLPEQQASRQVMTQNTANFSDKDKSKMNFNELSQSPVYRL